MAATSAVFEEDGTTLLTFADGRTIRAPSALLYDANGDPLITNPSAGQSGTGLLAVAPMGSNGASFDPQTNNQGITLLPSAARTTQQVLPVQTNYNARGVLLLLDVTAASGTGGLRLGIYTSPNGGGQGGDVLVLNNFSAVAYQTTTGPMAWVMYPGATNAAVGGSVLQVVSLPLPRQWWPTVFVGDASSYTYSLSAYLIV